MAERPRVCDTSDKRFNKKQDQRRKLKALGDVGPKCQCHFKIEQYAIHKSRATDRILNFAAYLAETCADPKCPAARIKPRSITAILKEIDSRC